MHIVFTLFATCSTESLFLRYKQISKKAVKLRSFFHCSVHIFLGHDGPPSCTPQKKPSSPIQFRQEENMPGNSIERRTYWFILKIARMFPIPLSRNRMMSTLIIVNITQRDDYAFPHSKKAFLLPSVWPETEYTCAIIWKKSLLICFESYTQADE